MKILIHGANGRMGQAVRGLIQQGSCGAVLAGAVSRQGGDGILTALEEFHGTADCLVDFSNHVCTRDVLAYAQVHRCPLVLATTGQTAEELAAIQAAAAEIPLFYAGNTSLGIAVLEELVKLAVRAFPEADIEIVEAHHNQKVDVPSGTAKMLAAAVQQVRPASCPVVGRHENGKRARDEIGIHSLRMGSTIGSHEVIVHAGTQVLTLKHEALDRSLFAEGALRAAAFLRQQRPGLYGMRDLIQNLQEEEA